jgi:hypothetical protein
VISNQGVGTQGLAGYVHPLNILRSSGPA